MNMNQACKIPPWSGAVGTIVHMAYRLGPQEPETCLGLRTSKPVAFQLDSATYSLTDDHSRWPAWYRLR